VDAALRLRAQGLAPADVTVIELGVAKPVLRTIALRSLPEERAAEIAARTLALPDAQSVEDLTALLTSAGER
jgi:hypothetical protein